MERKLKIGIMGSLRGSSFARSIQYIKEAEFTALCENNEDNIKQIRPYMTDETTVYNDFDEFINSGIDAVILCNYFNEHAPYAIKAFKAGVPVLSETTAAASLGECVKLVEACEKYNGKYMLAANCMYFRSVHAMKEKYDRGETGKAIYGEAEYIHGPEVGSPDKSGQIDKNNLHWRQCLPGNMYNMHTLAPLMYITGAMPLTVSCTMLRNDEMTRKNGSVKDCLGGIVITKMDDGSVFNTTGAASYQPTSKWYRLACEKQTMETERYDWREEKLIVAKDAAHMEVSYPSEIESGLVREGDNIKQEDVAAAGHGGIDYYITYRFIQFALGKEEAFFDVYRSATLSAVGILGWYSALLDSKEMKIPDFRDKAQRDEIRNDFRNPFAKKYDELTLPCRLDEKDKFQL